MLVLRPRPACEASILLAFSVKHKKKEVGIVLEEEIGGNPGITNQDFAVFASLQLSLVYQCEAPQIPDDLGDWTAEKGKQKRGNYLELIEVELT